MDFDASAAAGQTGGSDGCVDFDDIDNNGLKACLADLRPIYCTAATVVSVADFLVIAAEAVMTATAPGAGTGTGTGTGKYWY
jgi:hypothetical protein